MKIKTVHLNNRKQLFEIEAGESPLTFPYAKCEVSISRGNPIEKVWLDPELGNEAFTFTMKDGTEGTVHIDHVLEFNRDPKFMAELLLYKLSLEVKKHLISCGISNREVIRRLGTSASQYYRLLDPTNTKKSVSQMLGLLQILGWSVDIFVKDWNKKKRRVLISV